MKLQLIETENYVLAVSDEDIDPIKDYVLRDSFIMKPNTYNLKIFSEYKHKKIIAYQPKDNAPELDLPLLPEEECCEGDGSNCNGSCCVIEDDVEKLAEEYADFSNEHIPMSFGDKFNETSKRDFIAGYKAATKIYSEEALRGFCKFYTENLTNSIWDSMELYIQSLKQPTPKWFVAEMEYQNLDGKWGSYYPFASSAKDSRLETTTINNKTYLVGKYLNE